MKIAGATVLGIVVSLFLVWFFLLRAPAPEAVCQHLIDVAVREAGERSPQAVESLADRIRLTCTREKRDLLRLRGKYIYARHAECVMAAQTWAEAEGC